ncbi:unnamed protein product [Alternaria alternata]
MAPNYTAEANSTDSERVPSKGGKRKRDGTSDPQSSSVLKRKNGAVGVPSKQTDCQKALEGAKIVKELRITFHPQKFSPQRPGNVPEEHQTKFKHIQQLGKISYDSYAVQPRPDTANKPWEIKNKERATLVSEEAVQAMSDFQNEDGWRMAGGLEDLIFQRFKIEVACQECRKRLWQSLVEVNPEESNSRTKNLAERQHRRTVCDCEPSSKQNGILSTGRTKIFSTRIGERSIIQDDPENHHGTEMKPDRDVVRLWQGDITGYDEALQLVLIMDYIVDWARDIFRPSIIRQLMSVVDKGKESSYTMVEGHDILSIRDYANSSYGDWPIPNIGEAGTFEAPAQPDFDAVSSTTGSSFEPLFESTGKHVDIRVWEAAKYESRVRGLFITENDTAATEHHIHKDYQRLWTVDMGRYWFLLPNVQGIKILEEAWTGSQKIKDMQDVRQQRILISLYVQYRKDVNGAPIRELTYLAVTETAARYMLEEIELVVPAEEVGIKLREAWASSDKNYFQRYAKGQTGVLCVTASDYDKSVDRVVLGFYSGREMTNHARRLDSFFKSTCKDRQAELYKIYATCSRYTKVVHSLTVEPHCVLDPTQDCVFVNIDAMRSGIYAYVTNAASEMISRTSMIRHLVQMVAVLWDNTSLNISSSFSTNDESRIASKILLWIVSDPQWDLYDTMKSNLTGMDKVHNHLAWYRKVLLRHECGTGTVGSEHGHSTIETECIKEGHKNIQRYIQRACKKCDFKHYADPASSGPTFSFCDEDFMPENGF